jgi:hypothetical protein
MENLKRIADALERIASALEKSPRKNIMRAYKPIQHVDTVSEYQALLTNEILEGLPDVCDMSVILSAVGMENATYGQRTTFGRALNNVGVKQRKTATKRLYIIPKKSKQ